MDFYFEAYDDLATCKGESGFIPWLAIDAYARRFDFDQEFAVWFISAIREIDKVSAEVRREQQPAPKAGA